MIYSYQKELKIDIKILNPIYKPLYYQFGNESKGTIEIYYNGINHYESVYSKNIRKEENSRTLKNVEMKSTDEGKTRNDDVLDEMSMMEIVEKIDVINKNFYCNVKEGRIVAKRIVKGPQSLIWSVCH